MPCCLSDSLYTLCGVWPYRWKHDYSVCYIFLQSSFTSLPLCLLLLLLQKRHKVGHRTMGLQKLVFCAQALPKIDKIQELQKGTRLSSRICCSGGLPGLGWTAGRDQRRCDHRDIQQTWIWGHGVLRERGRDAMMLLQMHISAGTGGRMKESP